MTGQLTLYDAIDDSQYPPAGPGACFAGYVDGGIGDQPDYHWLTVNRPGSRLLSIALDPAHNADALDIENGAATPESAAAWYERQKARGIARPCFYANVSTMQANLVPVIEASGIARVNVRLWTAHYQWRAGAAAAHICGPATCGQLSIDADATQWTDNAGGRDLDQSLLRADFFGGWVFGPVRNLTMKAGPHSLRLTWSSPAAPAPEPVHHYQVTVRHLGADIHGFPADVPKTGSSESHQWNGVEAGSYDEAMVRACAVDGHASPWATVTPR